MENFVKPIILEKKESVRIIVGQNLVLELDPNVFKTEHHADKILITCDLKDAADLYHTLQRAL